MELWAPWAGGRCPCSWQGGRTRWSLRSLPTQTILWFFTPFPSMHTTRLSDTGSRLPTGTSVPFLVLPLAADTQLSQSKVEWERHSNAGGHATAQAACPRLLHGTKTSLRPRVNPCSHNISSKERLPKAHETDNRLKFRRWQRSLWQYCNLELGFPSPEFMLVAAPSFHYTT